MKKTSLCALVFLCGCATTNSNSGLKARIQNSPMVSVSGPRVFIEVRTQDQKPLRTPFADLVKAEAHGYLAERGFKAVESPADAHTILVFVAGSRDRQISVPAQTYLMPIYNPGQQTNVNVQNNSGGWASGSVSSQGQMGWTQGYRGGYVAQIQDQWIELAGYVQRHGYRAKLAFNGQVWRTHNAVDFSSEPVVKRAIQSLLSKTMLAKVDELSLSETAERPGCFYVLGVVWNKEKVDQNEGFFIERFMPSSSAKSAGLAVGDHVLSINEVSLGHVANDPARLDELLHAEQVHVTFERSGKTKTTAVKPTLSCPG